MGQPSLSELTHLFADEPPKPKFKALCENIFDVPRSGLLDVLETLQEAFWTDEPDPSIYRPSPTPQHATLDRKAPQSATQPAESEITQPSFKRQRPNNQATPSSSAGTDYIQPTSPSPPSSPSHTMTAPPIYASTSKAALKKAVAAAEAAAVKTSKQATPMKSAAPPSTRLKLWTVKWLLVKQLKSPAAEYKEKEVMALWQSFQTQGTPTEIRHLANYLYPVACGMRRYTMAQSFQTLVE